MEETKFKFIYGGIGVLVAVLLTISILFGIWGGQKVYTSIDQVVFDTYQINKESITTEEDKGIELLNSILVQLEYELDSPFGWSANDFLFNKYILDNRAYRQFGVYNATKTIIDYYSINVAKLGNSDKENNSLYSARMNYFAISPSRWGVAFIPSSESSYKEALKLSHIYMEDLKAGTAVYNLRTDDVYTALDLIVGDKLLGYAIGLLQKSKLQSYTLTDDKIYEAQGMVIVTRNFFNTLYELYPEMFDKNNEQNYLEAMDYLDKICNYNPLLITQTFNSTELIISYLLFARNRLEDIKESIRI